MEVCRGCPWRWKARINVANAASVGGAGPHPPIGLGGGVDGPTIGHGGGRYHLAVDPAAIDLRRFHTLVAAEGAQPDAASRSD
ncbi:MAG: hypothetical protein V7637_2844 [Mycobacteriales bacterium]